MNYLFIIVCHSESAYNDGGRVFLFWSLLSKVLVTHLSKTLQTGTKSLHCPWTHSEQICGYDLSDVGSVFFFHLTVLT